MQKTTTNTKLKPSIAEKAAATEKLGTAEVLVKHQGVCTYVLILVGGQDGDPRARQLYTYNGESDGVRRESTGPYHQKPVGILTRRGWMLQNIHQHHPVLEHIA